jgi:putative transposase
VRSDGSREVLGWWFGGSEGESADIWDEILRELKERGVKGVELFVTDGLRGLKEGILRHFPTSGYQRCVLHAVRYTLTRVRVSDRERVAIMLKRIYRAGSRKEAQEALEDFKRAFRSIYPQVVKLWEENFEDLLRFLDFPSET